MTSVNNETILQCQSEDVPSGSSLVLAYYKNGVLVGTQFGVYRSEPLYFVITQAFDEAKVMAWDGLATMKPVCGAASVQ